MRPFNKIFIIALPRCATVSLCDALGMLGIKTAHLGRIYGELTNEHHHPQRLTRIYEQICQGDYELDILRECRGLADYPVCCLEVLKRLDQQYPNSLFVNVRRDSDLNAWIQSVERQFVGLQLIKQSSQASDEEQRFMQVVLAFRAMTFGQSEFDPDVYLRAYHAFQLQVEKMLLDRPADWLQFESVEELATVGFDRLCRFLDCPHPQLPFPNCNAHSQRPLAAYMQALASGKIQVLTRVH